MSLRTSPLFSCPCPSRHGRRALLAEGVDRHAFDVVVFGNGDDDGNVRNDVFHLESPSAGNDFGFALAFVVFAELFQFFLDDAADELFAGQK